MLGQTIIISKRKTISLFILTIGLALGIYFVQQAQIYQGKAQLDLSRTFSVSVDEGGTQPVACQDTTCTTDQEEVYIKFNEDQLQDLLNTLP